MKIIGLVGENKMVLDVGCATGYVGKRLKKRLRASGNRNRQRMREDRKKVLR